MGMLYVVPTPVGNLADITQRALDVLRGSDVVLAEDTRTTGVLLKHYGIEARLSSHHKYNEHQTAAALAERMAAGETMALVSDAGTPAMSDPGYMLVRACAERGVEVQCLPGPTAFVPAVVDSALPCERFAFEGFLPLKKGRATRIAALAIEERTMVIYESPRRVEKTLRQLAEAFGGDRRAAVTREISKVHEETLRGTLASLADTFAEEEPRGEFVIVVEGLNRKARGHADEADAAGTEL